MPDTAADKSLDSAAVIEIRLSRPQQLFNSLDPCPFHDRDLDQDAQGGVPLWLAANLAPHTTLRQAGPDPSHMRPT